VDQFISEAATRVRGIQEAMERSDARALANCAHSLKGSSSSMGAVQLAARCAELEARSKSGTLEGVAPLAGQVDYECQRACAALLAQTGIPASRVASSGA
jgi:HPt (histidine-containing phosphotransfer) domain-containing protein